MNFDISANELLVLYRHAKALNDHLSTLLQDHMILRCKVCGNPHKKHEPHISHIEVINKPHSVNISYNEINNKK